MSSFPRSKYARYKRATTFFLDWLLRARDGGRHVGGRVELEAFNDVVKAIAVDPSTLTPKLLQELPKALAACQCAITLREHVATFFPEDDKGQEGHQYFLELLQSWHKTLKGLKVEAPVGSKNTIFENYYQVLQSDEDYFQDPEHTCVVESGASKSVKVDRGQLFEEAFADELRMELVYFFVELDELMQSVWKVYVDVKKEKRTLVEATVVAQLAMSTASALTAQLQLKYPSLRTAEQMFNIVRNMAPESFRLQMLAIHTKYLNGLYDTIQNGDCVAPYVPGMFLMDFVGVGTTLDTFITAIPLDPTRRIHFQAGCFGEVYGEDRTPQYVLFPEPSNKKTFLLQQLPLLYKTIVQKKVAAGSGYGSSGSFMVLIKMFFSTREVTVPLVFACICWMKSVAALQGNAGLGRNVSLAFKHSAQLMENIEATLTKGTAHKQTNELLQRWAAETKQSTQLRYLARANPLFAGLTMLDHHLKYLHIAHETMFATSRFRSFSHLYNALVQEGYLERIPFFDKVLEVYAQQLFTPSRAAAVHGAYFRTLLHSLDLRITSVDVVCRGEALPAGKNNVHEQKSFHWSDLSKTFRLTVKNDKSVLEGASWTAMLDGAADMCSAELFDTRVLSRDLLKLNDDLADMFAELCDELKQREYAKARTMPGEHHQQPANCESEDAVITLLLPLLDALQSNGSVDTNAISGVMPTKHISNMDVATSMCRKTAAVIKNKFATPRLVCAQKYFTFPLQPDFVSQEYGSASFESRLNNETRGQVFSDLMKMLKNSDGPLSGRDLSYLKSEIRKDPELLGMTSACSVATNSSENDDDLGTLFHQAAAGPAHDCDLVEWMIQMGALLIQPTLYCRKESRQNDLSCPQLLLNSMAVHSAAIAGYEDIIQIILEADNFIDLNTPTFHTKETLAHLAVKYGHRSIFNMLVWFRADLRINDSDGRRVCDVTVDQDWAREIAAYTAECFAKRPGGATKRNKLFHTRTKSNAARLHNQLSAEHDEKNDSARPAEIIKKKKCKKKGKQGKKNATKEGSMIATVAAAGVGVDTSSEERSRLLKRLLVSVGYNIDADSDLECASVLENLLRKFTVATFARLRDPQIPPTGKTDDVQHAYKLIQELTGFVQMFSDPSRLNSTHRHLRVVIASETWSVIHLMQKFYRVDHAAIAVPELDPIRELCDTTLSFTEFVVGTAQICVSVDRKAQAREVLDVLEKRLMKAASGKRRPFDFRELVQTYSEARDAMGLGLTSSTATFRSLEWYLTSAVDDYRLQLTLDGMAGRPFYFDLRLTTGTSDLQFDHLKRTIDAVPDLNGVACFDKSDKHVIYGGTSEFDVTRARESMLSVAGRTGLQFDDFTSLPCTPIVRVGEFVFSSAGILRSPEAD